MATLGVTWYAQAQLGELLFVEPPEVEVDVVKDHPYAEVESPETIDADPYGQGWLVRLRVTAPDEIRTLLSADAYRELLS